MAVVKPFCCIRPDASKVSRVAALPYDVYSRKEAYQVVAGNPLSFLNIDRAETQFSEEVGMYDDCVYEKARELLWGMVEDGVFVSDDTECYYLYRLTMNGRSQTGIVACSGADDYLNGVVKKHENTREEKELDRIRHVDRTNAQTGPIFLTYKSSGVLSELMCQMMDSEPLYDFVSEDKIRHQVWRESDADMVKAIEEAFASVGSTYIADGHHRAASAVKVALKRRGENADHNGSEPYNFFLSVLFPDDQLMVMPYNRVVKDLNGLTKEEFLARAEENFKVTALGQEGMVPEEKGTFGMYLEDSWYRLEAKPGLIWDDPIKGLDVSILQDYLLAPVLGIEDARIDKRIDFIGGIRGLWELERRVSEDMAVAFSMYPTSIDELLRVADAHMLMPPKSTWFEPKLRSGLFIHGIGTGELHQKREVWNTK